jgi:hypothetical protein
VWRASVVGLDDGVELLLPRGVPKHHADGLLGARDENVPLEKIDADCAGIGNGPTGGGAALGMGSGACRWGGGGWNAGRWRVDVERGRGYVFLYLSVYSPLQKRRIMDVLPTPPLPTTMILIDAATSGPLKTPHFRNLPPAWRPSTLSILNKLNIYSLK